MKKLMIGLSFALTLLMLSSLVLASCPSTWSSSPNECWSQGLEACQDKRCCDTVAECGTCGCEYTACVDTTQCCQWPSCGLAWGESLNCINNKCTIVGGTTTIVVTTTPVTTTPGPCTPNGGNWINSPNECCNVGCQDKRCVATIDDCGICACPGGTCTSDASCCQYPQCGLSSSETVKCEWGFLGSICKSSECISDQDCQDKYGSGWYCREETGECFSTGKPCSTDQECINKFSEDWYCAANGQCVVPGGICNFKTSWIPDWVPYVGSKFVKVVDMCEDERPCLQRLKWTDILQPTSIPSHLVNSLRNAIGSTIGFPDPCKICEERYVQCKSNAMGCFTKEGWGGLERKICELRAELEGIKVNKGDTWYYGIIIGVPLVLFLLFKPTGGTTKVYVHGGKK